MRERRYRNRNSRDWSLNKKMLRWRSEKQKRAGENKTESRERESRIKGWGEKLRGQ